MNWKLHLISLFAIISIAAACGSPEPGKSAISTDKSQIQMVEGGGAQLVKVTANSSWSVTSNADWLSVTPSGGNGNATVTIEATENKGDARTATLNFGTTDGSSSCPVTVSQSAGRPDTPDTPDVPAGYSSIADLRKMYMGSDVTVSKDIKVKGTVISDYRNADNGGLNNNTSLKALVIADETAGIFLYCASDNTSFLQGDEVEVSLKGQTLSRYQGGPLQVNGIPLSKVTKVGDGKMPAPLEITAKQFLSGDYESRYVAVKDVQVSSSDLGKSFVMNGAHTSISVETGDGDSFDIFSSKYSSYGATAVPEGSGTICGIGSVYGKRYQIVFAKKSDWEGLTGERFAAGAIFTLKSTSYSTSGEGGTARINLISTISWNATVSDSKCSFSTTSGSEGAEIILTYPANPSTTDSREIKVTFTTTDTEAASGEVVFTLTQAPYEALTRTAVVPYLELPKVSEADSLLYISHETTYNGTTLHSWSALYDLRYRVSPWVAYRLDKTLGLSNAERSQNFYYDPAVPRRDQADLTSGSYKGDGIRGHQIPSADRLLSREANDQTFYATNIAPQNSSFNEGIWVNLENSVRRWADKCDTLYVVTGCCVTTSANPDVKWSNDRNGKLVAYPQKYYKVVLSYSKSRTENGGYSAIGFILDNDSYADNTLYLSGDKSHAKPVSEIETLTGFDFFCNLPDDIEKKVEESVTLSDWQ